MITSLEELQEYLEADKKALGRKTAKPRKLDFIWRFEISLRQYEYTHNCIDKLFLGKLRDKYYKIKYSLLSTICGYEIPINVIGKGLSIAHKGPIIINSHSKIGENCRMHVCVNVGTCPGVAGACPSIGDNVYIAPGVKIYGRIKIGSGTVIGANSVVNKSFEEGNMCIAGIPARKISDLGRSELEHRNIELYTN